MKPLHIKLAKANRKGMLPNGRKAFASMQYFKALHAIYDHPDYINLQPVQKALLWDLCRQYNGHNNGDLSLAPKIMKQWGWTKSTILRNAPALLHNDWIFVSGHKKARNGFTYLYALTWLPVDECNGKLYPDSYNHQPKSLRLKGCKVTPLVNTKVA
ncbi:hypothetical protein LJ739_06665 [Aestuariibacter halophilus]|uniref:Uncharacterized protein n=1 Tax=Fluctibacter halophilus TaxID=226011 RepID=A0ABS8G689_9ALTE|nr:hypothetical protein [Aestuariibacter halophilus]MCC2615918.1 hypothetical protein [Aestuariibacter halophilus]